jgi:hypothetical protein
MTLAWIEETGGKPNGREEKRTTLAVTLDQGPAKETQEKNGHCYANQVVMRIHANYSWQSC